MLGFVFIELPSWSFASSCPGGQQDVEVSIEILVNLGWTWWTSLDLWERQSLLESE